MKTNELRECFQQLVECYSLRYLKKRKRYLGIFKGLCVDASEFDGQIALQFVSPSADIGEQVLEEFAGFQHWIEAGHPASWIRGRVVRDQVDSHGCTVVIDAGRLERMGLEQFLDIPNLIAQDLQEFGAVDSAACANCNRQPVTVVGLVDWQYSWFCRECWENLAIEADQGRIPVAQSVNWPLAAAIIFVLTIVGALGWGALQQPGQRPGFYSLMLPPMLWGFALCAVLVRFRVGVSPWLRLAICASVILSVLAGNVWGFRSSLPQQLQSIDWYDAVWLYFTVQLPLNFGDEVPFLAGGLIGAWIGLRFLKSEESVAVE